jgi:hypothetical protein
MMRKALVILALGVGLSIGYAIRPTPTAAQANFAPFTHGQSVRLVVENFPAGVTSIICPVTGISEGFIACADDGDRRQPRWVNLRYVQEMTPAPQR